MYLMVLSLPTVFDLLRSVVFWTISSAASERVSSQAGLIMSSTRSQMSKSWLAQLVLLKYNWHLH